MPVTIQMAGRLSVNRAGFCRFWCARVYVCVCVLVQQLVPCHARRGERGRRWQRGAQVVCNLTVTCHLEALPHPSLCAKVKWEARQDA